MIQAACPVLLAPPGVLRYTGFESECRPHVGQEYGKL